MIADREQWEDFKRKHPQVVSPNVKPLGIRKRSSQSDRSKDFIQLFISGDRQIIDLQEFWPYADKFISMNFFHSTLRFLEGLDKFVNLNSLNVSRTDIDNSQLRYIALLNNIGRLELNGNDINDLTLISNLNPRHLGLACLQITSLRGLENMSNIEILDLYGNLELTDIDALVNLGKLKDLDVRQTHISARDVMEQMPHISRIVSS